MPKTYTITKEEIEEIKAARKKNKDKDVDRRLHTVKLRGEGMKNREIAEKLDTVSDVVSYWVSGLKKRNEVVTDRHKNAVCDLTLTITHIRYLFASWHSQFRDF